MIKIENDWYMMGCGWIDGCISEWIDNQLTIKNDLSLEHQNMGLWLYVLHFKTEYALIFKMWPRDEEIKFGNHNNTN